MVTAGVYVRISLDVAGEGLGTERQETLCRELAKRKGWTVAEVYEDNDVSATSRKPRPAYQRLLADLESGKIDGVVVYAIDRLTRRPLELEHFIDLAERKNISLANVAGEIDLSLPMGQAQARMMGMVARLEAQNTGKRVRDQKQQRALSGMPHKGRHRLFGYDKDWNLIESEAAVIREAFIRRSKGESTTSIANDFTARGIKSVNGNDWKSGTLSVTLTKDLYAGWISLNGKRVAESKVPAIIDDDTFQAAQKNLANDSKGTNTRKYLLSGILLCGHDMVQMKGNPSNDMYRCSTTYGGCGRLSVRIAIADKWIPIAAMHKAIEKRSTDTAPVRNFDAEIAEAQDKRKNTQEAFEAGIYSLKEAKAKIKEYDDTIKTLIKEKAKTVTGGRYHTDRFLDFYKMNLAQKRAFISEHIEGVVVGPSISRGHQPFDPRRFTVHYTDGTKMVITPDMWFEEAPEDV